MKPGKRILVWIGLAAALLAGGAALVDTDIYRAYFEQRLVTSASAAGIRLGFSGGRVYPLGFRGDSATATAVAAGLPVTFQLQEFALRPCWWDLFRGRLCLQGSGLLCGGAASGRLGYRPTSGGINAEALVEKAALTMHPQLHSLGIQQGFLSLSLKDLSLFTAAGPAFSAGLRLIDLQTQQKLVLPQSVTGLPIDLSLPPVSQLNLNLALSLNQGALDIKSAALDSSWGKLSGGGRARLSDKGWTELEIAMQVELSASGLKEFGAWLPLASKEKLSASSKKFRISIKGTPPAARVEWEKL